MMKLLTITFLVALAAVAIAEDAGTDAEGSGSAAVIDKNASSHPFNYSDKFSSYEFKNNAARIMFDAFPPGTVIAGAVPRYVIQYGTPRSGSTFQAALLCTIMRIRDPLTKCISASDIGADRWQHVKAKGAPVMYKTHTLYVKAIETALPYEPVFASVHSRAETDDYYASRKSARPRPVYHSALVTQNYATFVACPLCEIQRYQKVFDLTENQILHLRDYFQHWMVLRKCCSNQASLEQRLTLHNCTRHRESFDPSHPHCEIYNLGAIEKLFMETKYYDIGYGIGSRTDDKHRVGGCAKSIAMMKRGADTNFVRSTGHSEFKFKCPGD